MDPNLCPYCAATMIVTDNGEEREIGGFTRIIPANRFWKECENNECRARGPVRKSFDEALEVGKRQ